jgi:CDP-diacylglycerol--glycerol-3-phosphate 3-phosphatidyltransferase
MIWTPDDVAAAALAGTVGLLALAAALRRPAAPAERVTREGGTMFLGAAVMQRGYALAQPLVAGAIRLGVSPDAITWASLVFGAGSGAALAAGLPGCAAWLLGLRGLCDLLDGAVARATGRAGAAGAALDSVLDRYVEFFFHAGALYLFAGHAPAQLAVLAALFGAMMITYSTAKAEALGLTPPRGWMKRPERIVWLLGGATAAGLTGPAALVVAFTVVAVAANVSAILRLAALHRAARG